MELYSPESAPSFGGYTCTGQPRGVGVQAEGNDHI